MKRVINFGSMNIDHVYQVDHLVNPGETLAALCATRQGAASSIPDLSEVLKFLKKS